ncbi:hypothetical protein [Sphingomonas sp. Leaf20]|uniref:hypothetical protein n=1 Tax=Sphingomonas sp. Leaf20 TaxID=1735685 RepID=UPI000701F9E2|nr:hypothetical protein [Sphingomonas sp. Leaf20]KQM72087.1 hypothetical protein ASE72_11570 [Sphingomonas sp. Leaf20]
MRKTILTLAFTAGTIAATACAAQSAPAAPSSRADTAAANRAALSATLATQTQETTAPARPEMMNRGPQRRGGPMRAVTRAEAIADADARFARMDSDGDGILTAAERRSFREERREAMRERREQRMAAQGGAAGADHANARRDPDRGARGGMGRADRQRAGAGRDDGVVTRAEFSDRAAQRFDRMDANRDGRLDASERPGGRAMRRGPGRGRHHAMGATASPTRDEADRAVAATTGE